MIHTWVGEICDGEKYISLMREKIDVNRCISLCQLSTDLNISYRLIFNIVHKELNFKVDLHLHGTKAVIQLSEFTLLFQ